MIINKIGIKKDINFEKLYGLMEQDLGVDRMPDIAYQYGGRYWEDLLKYSEEYYSFCGEPGLLFPVLHKIHWGMHPECEYTDLQKEMLAVLDKVIRTDGMSKLTWMQLDYFEHQMCLMLVSHTAYTNAAPSYISECHERYMLCKTNRILYGNNGLVQDASEEDPYPEAYESIIKEILPDAHTWPEEAWLGEEKIYEGLAVKYGLVYTNDDHYDDGLDYSSLICLLEQKGLDVEYDIHLLAGMKTCTMDMAAVIWPGNAKTNIIEEFCRVGEAVNKKAVSAFDMKELLSCWLYKQVCTWMDNGGIPSELSHAVKEARFNMELLGC